MNNKEFITELAKRMNYSAKETTQMANLLIREISEQLENENYISISGLGTFEVRKKLERVLVNPSTKQRMLIPPKMSVNFKVSPVLKEKINAQIHKQ